MRDYTSWNYTSEYIWHYKSIQNGSSIEIEEKMSKNEKYDQPRRCNKRFLHRKKYIMLIVYFSYLNFPRLSDVAS